MTIQVTNKAKHVNSKDKANEFDSFSYISYWYTLACQQKLTVSQAIKLLFKALLVTLLLQCAHSQ